jgi:hypothetical protein
MNNLFDTLFDISDSADSLDRFLNENMQTVNEFYNSNYACILLSKNSIEKFILLKYNAISQLDFTKSYAKSFALMLLDFCERFNFIAATPRIYTILAEHDIFINSRLQAALQFLYPKPETNSELVDRFDVICEKLQLAIDTEEDNDNKSIATFLNYYGIVVNDTSLDFAEQVRNKIITAIQNETYDFLKNDNIATIADIASSDLDIAYTQIQNIIDKVLGKEVVVVYVPDTDIEKYETRQEFIIETDTDYARELALTPNNFDSIRSISVRRAGTQKISGRGVKILETEEELFGYFKSYGNMHKAKLMSALEALPDSFESNIRIIDWGCGQGFASMIFLEKYGNDNVNHITLIEPSELALKRAALHCRKYSPETPLKTICKKLDDLTEYDLILPQSNIMIHLFSNILDIDGYSQSHLIELIKQTHSGENYFVCASPYIDVIKTERVESFKRHFENRYDSFEVLSDITNTKNLDDAFWCCNNTYTHGNVNHGNYFNCNGFNECGCYNKWTRVINVFKVNL